VVALGVDDAVEYLSTPTARIPSFGNFERQGVPFDRPAIGALSIAEVAPREPNDVAFDGDPPDAGTPSPGDRVRASIQREGD
jgi:hypothetical protein